MPVDPAALRETLERFDAASDDIDTNIMDRERGVYALVEIDLDWGTFEDADLTEGGLVIIAAARELLRLMETRKDNLESQIINESIDYLRNRFELLLNFDDITPWSHVMVAAEDRADALRLIETAETVEVCETHGFQWYEPMDRCGLAPWEPIDETICRMVVAVLTVRRET